MEQQDTKSPWTWLGALKIWWRKIWIYPLVMTNIAIENGSFIMDFTHEKWWLSIVMLVYQRVVDSCWLYTVYYSIVIFIVYTYYESVKFTLNSKRFPRLKSTFPLWLNLQSSPRYIQKRISALVPFLSRPQAIRTSPLPPFGLNFFWIIFVVVCSKRSGLQRLGDAEKTFQGLKSFFLFPRCLFYKRICRGSIPPKFDSREEKLQQQHQDTPLHLKL